MKKVFIILLTFFIIMSVGCTKDNKIKDSTISNSSSLTSNSQTASVIETEKQPYEDIKCFIPSGFKNIYVKSPNDSLSLNLSLPKEWSITKSASALQIRRDGKNIGEIVAGIPKESRTSLYEYNASFLGVEVIHNIYRTSDSSFEHVFNYIYKNENSKKREFTLKTRYEEVSKNTTIRIVDYATTTPAKTEDNIGALKLTDNRKKILILGNSFINSSNIGTTLQEMVGKDIVVEAVSIGMANVSTHTSDPARVKSIADGNYSAVFMCGFFATERDVTAFETIVSACKNSKTKLAIFPAHNEQRTVIDNAVKKYPSYAVLLDWKAEIDNLITPQLDEFNFCIDDYHKHSNTLAGFVGAHLIYRAIYGKTPNVSNKEFSSVTKTQLNKISHYLKDCTFTLVEEDKLYTIGK